MVTTCWNGSLTRARNIEGANPYEETGTPISDVSQLLGHSNLATTSRYLRNKRRRMAQLAVTRLDQARPRPRRRARWPRSSRRPTPIVVTNRRDRTDAGGPAGKETRS